MKAVERVHMPMVVDAGGAPEWRERFMELVNYPLFDTDAQAALSFPVRFHLRQMWRRGGSDAKRAVFLFRLACQDYDVMAAARECSRLADHEDARDLFHDYAEVSLRQLHWHLTRPENTDLEGRRRKILPRKSDAQIDAEQAA